MEEAAEDAVLRCEPCNTAACNGTIPSEVSLSANSPANKAADIRLRSKFAFPTRAQMTRPVRNLGPHFAEPSSLEIRLQLSQSVNYPAFWERWHLWSAAFADRVESCQYTR